LQDHLYDEQTDHSVDPQQLLDDLERLYNGSWNQRSHTLDWKVGRAGKRTVESPIRQSGSTKVAPLRVIENKNLRGHPSGVMVGNDDKEPGSSTSVPDLRIPPFASA
jgi:hypothetical protein